jgi:hypothetical protein
VGVVLNESLDTSAQWVTGSGHTAIYFSRICPASPVRLRLCRPGENGSVMSDYLNLGEDRRYEWNIAPLDVYLYGVQDLRNRPLFNSPKLKALLERKYRLQALSDYCSTEQCVTGEKAEWREMVAATMSRSIYIFFVDTSLQQDLNLIAEFNALPNKDRFDGMTNNCADFVKRILDTYFPHSAHRDVIDDFGMTSPKAVARSFSHYALRHRDLQLSVLHFSQLPGTIHLSSEPRNGTEQLFHSKLLVPMAIFADHELAVVTATYFLHGRFSPEREFEAHPAVETAETREWPGQTEVLPISAREDSRHDLLRAAYNAPERREIVGAKTDWKEYRTRFHAIVEDAVRQGLIPSSQYLGKFFTQLDGCSEPYVAANGSLWLKVSCQNDPRELGVGADSIFAPGSDPHLAFVFLLARINAVLKSPKHRRETMLEFTEDWSRLEYARNRVLRVDALASVPPGSASDTVFGGPPRSARGN